MKSFLVGVAWMVVSICIVLSGLYFGLVWGLAGGIADIINQFKAEETDAWTIAWAIIKICMWEIPLLLGCFVGIISGILAAIFTLNEYDHLK